MNGKSLKESTVRKGGVRQEPVTPKPDVKPGGEKLSETRRSGIVAMPAEALETLRRVERERIKKCERYERVLGRVLIVLGQVAIALGEARKGLPQGESASILWRERNRVDVAAKEIRDAFGGKLSRPAAEVALAEE